MTNHIKKTLSIFSLAIVGMLIATSISLADVGGSTYYVSPEGVDGFPCDGSAGAPWATIQHAVNTASEGDTIYVTPGTYYEKITIDKGLKLIGDPSAGVGVNGGAPIIDGSNFFDSGDNAFAFEITNNVNNLSISGFYIRNFKLSPDDFNNGVYTAAVFIYEVVTNNFEFSHNYLQNIDGLGVVIRNDSNYNNAPIINYNRMEDVSEQVFYLNNLTNADISYNEFFADRTDTFATAIYLSADGAIGSPMISSNNQITNNTFTSTNNYPTNNIVNIATSSSGDNGGIFDGLIFNNNNFLISNNNGKTAMKIDVTGTADSINNLNIVNNTFDVTSAKSLDIQGTGSINNLTIRDNKFIGTNNTGVTSALAINAERNWWGDASGPYNAASNTLGLGSDASNNIDYAPWYGADYTDGDHSSPWNWHTNGVNGSTIQETIDLSSNGDTVHVGAGVYNEQLVLDKTISLIGDIGNAEEAGPGENAPTIDGSIFEGSLEPLTAITVNTDVNNIAIKGFNIVNFNPADEAGDTIAIMAYDVDTDGLEISNNYINNICNAQPNLFCYGIVLSDNINGNNNAILSYNKINNLNGNSFYLYNINNSQINNNDINIGDNEGVAIYLSSQNGGTLLNNEIKNNTITSAFTTGLSAMDLYIKDADDLEIANNTFSISGFNNKAAIYMHTTNPGDSINNINIHDNNINADESRAIKLDTVDQLTGLTLRNNIFSGTNSLGILSNFNVDAKHNWWGTTNGPYNAEANPSGTGPLVSDVVSFRSWCSESSCVNNDEITPTATLAYSKNTGATFNNTARVKRNNTLIIKATFNESIEDATGAKISIDNEILSPTAMEKINSTTYQYKLSVPSGNINTATVSISNVADLSGNILSSTNLRTFTIDETNPVISLIGDNPQIIEVNNDYVELGATGNDNFEGNISENIIINNSSVNTEILGDYLVTYNLEDQAGNVADQVTRTVSIVDTTEPTIALVGDANITLTINDTYTEQGATASDNYNGNISTNIVISGEVNTSVAGTYTVKYNVEDESGNHATEKTRTITVNNRGAVSGGDGGGGGGSSTPSTYQVYNPNTGETSSGQNNTSNEQVGTLETNEPTEGQVLGVKITNTSNNQRESQLQQIINDAKEIFSGQLENILQNNNRERNLESEKNTADKYIKSLTSNTKELSNNAINAMNNFITYGTESTNILGEGERAGVLNSFKSTFGKLPSTEADWSDVVKIANGRWPNQRNEKMETKAETTFQKIYLRKPDRNNPNDDAAVTVMAYGLRPSDRNLDSEKTAIKTFRYIFNTNPKSASDWDAVRAIAYSGSKR